MTRRFVATFHTHASAILTGRSLCAHGARNVHMAPVPRELSSSCGTCVLYEAQDTLEGFMDEDAEAVYSITDANAKTLYALERRFTDE